MPPPPDPTPEAEPRTKPASTLPKPELPSDLPATTDFQGRKPVRLPDEEFHAPKPGRTFGKYELLETIARGGMGIVYKALDTSLGRVVALKMIRNGVLAGPDEVRRFHQEARAAAPLRHPHVIPVYEIGEEGGYHYFTMPFAPGGSLAGRMEALRADPRAAVALVEKIARAVHTAHRHGILHRDLKPANVLLDENGEPLIADFGLARFLDGSPGLTDPGQVVGTPSYLSPEQAAGRADLFGPATDVWALGVLLCELLTGRRPFVGEERSELIRAILTAEPPDLTALRPDLDPGLASVVRKCLRKEQERRYRSAEALADDLRCWLKGEPLSSDSSASVTSLPLSPARRHPVLYFVLAPLLVLGLALAVANLFRPHQPPAPGVVLIGETGPPERFRWIPREGDVDITSGPGEPFSFKTSKVALLELLDAPPGPRYRLEAELRHDEGVPEPRFESEVGLFFAHQAYRDAESEFHGFFQTGFRDLPGSSGLWLYFRTYLGEVPFSYQQSFSPLLPLQPMRVPKVLPFWRHIAVEVTPEEIRLFSGDQLLRRVTPGMEHKPMPRINGQVIEVEPNLKGGGLGLMVWKGRGSFRNVIVTPLP